MSSAYLEGRYQINQFQNEYVSMAVMRLKLSHYLLFCLLYMGPREIFLSPTIQSLVNSTSEEAALGLLTNNQLFITYVVAQFVLAAKKLHSFFVKEHNAVLLPQAWSVSLDVCSEGYYDQTDDKYPFFKKFL